MVVNMHTLVIFDHLLFPFVKFVQALTIHWQSYADTIRVVLAVDDAQFPDCHDLLDDFAESLKLIREAASGAYI
jgi:hypothetical protein